MTHAKVETALRDHPKAVECGPTAMGVWLGALLYIRDHLTDGFIPHGAIAGLFGGGKANASAAKRLANAGLFEEVEGGYMLAKYSEKNQTKAQVNSAIEEARERMRKRRSSTFVRTNIDRTNKEVPTSTSISSSGSDPEGVQGEAPADVGKTGVLPSHARYADAYALGIQDAGFTFSGISAPWEYGALGRACAHAEGRRGADLEAWFRAAACAFRRLMADKSGQAGYQPSAFLRWLDDTQWRMPRPRAPRMPQERRSPVEAPAEAQPLVDASAALLDVSRLFEPKAVAK